MPRGRAGIARQRGWASILALLIALALIALLAGGVLRQYGLGDPGPRAEKAPRSVGATDDLRDATPAASDVVPSAPAGAIPKARALEGALQRQSDDMHRQIEEQVR